VVRRETRTTRQRSLAGRGCGMMMVHFQEPTRYPDIHLASLDESATPGWHQWRSSDAWTRSMLAAGLLRWRPHTRSSPSSCSSSTCWRLEYAAVAPPHHGSLVQIAGRHRNQRSGAAAPEATILAFSVARCDWWSSAAAAPLLPTKTRSSWTADGTAKYRGRDRLSRPPERAACGCGARDLAAAASATRKGPSLTPERAL